MKTKGVRPTMEIQKRNFNGKVRIPRYHLLAFSAHKITIRWVIEFPTNGLSFLKPEREKKSAPYTTNNQSVTKLA
jgi:hypothetical protein